MPRVRSPNAPQKHAADVYDDDDDVWLCVFPSNNAVLSARSAARHIMQLSKLTMNNRQFAGPPLSTARTNKQDSRKRPKDS